MFLYSHKPMHTSKQYFNSIGYDHRPIDKRTKIYAEAVVQAGLKVAMEEKI